MERETIAVLDLGTNTFHLLIVSINQQGEIKVKEKYRETVKLAGENVGQANIISPEAWERAIAALTYFHTILGTRKIDKVLANATSAIREAENGAALVKEVKTKLGLTIKTIGGNEEAALIYEGVKNGIDLPYPDNVLIMDIGGGSIELIVANKNNVKLLRSLPIGSLRLLNKIKPADPMTSGDIKAIEAEFQHYLQPVIKEIAEFDVNILIGSSGTFETLGQMMAKANSDKYAQTNLNGYSFQTKDYMQLHKQLCEQSRSHRLQIPGMEARRVDLMPIGSMMTKYILDELDIEKVVTSTFAMKEGLLFTYLEEKMPQFSTARGIGLKERSVLNLAHKFDFDANHANQVSHLGQLLFKELQPLHQLREKEKEMLYYASLLHDIGHYISRSGHHKHSQYIILNSRMPGFSSYELLFLSNLARYHRKSTPKPEHTLYVAMNSGNQKKMNYLAGILRLASSLDRSRRSLVKDIKVRYTDQEVRLMIKSDLPAILELQSAVKNTRHFELAFKRKVIIEKYKS